MPNILDLIARVSWDTNEKELNGMNKTLTAQDKILEELRQKGKRLDDQMVQTNDPAKVKKYNDELQQTKQLYDKQKTAVADLAKQQKELVRLLRENNDPKVVQGLLRNLQHVESQMDSLTAKTGNFGGKLGGIGKGLMSVIGIGAGGFGLYELAQGIGNIYNAANEEASQAEQGLLQFEQTLKNIGQQKLFDTLVNDADVLAKKYKNLFDNDDILKGQAKFIESTRVSQEELQKLIPIAIELAAKLGTDVTTASEMLVNAIIGRTSPELKRLGLDMKGLGDQTSRVNEITGDFATLLAGSVDTALKTTQGQTQQLNQVLANLEENLGKKTLKLKRLMLELKLGAAEAIDNLLTTDEDRRNAGVERAMNSYFKEYEKMSKGELERERENNKKRVHEANIMRREMLALYEEADGIGRHTKTGQDRVYNLRRQADYLKSEYEIQYRDIMGQTAALNMINQSAGKGAMNANAGRDEEETAAVKKANTSLKKKFEKVSKEDPVIISFKLDDDKDNLEKQAQAITDNKNKLYKQASDNLNKLNSEQVLGLESVTDADAKELEKQINNRVKANEKKKEVDQVSNEEAKAQLYNNTIDLAREAQSQLDIEQRKTDRLIALQEKRVAAAENNSKASLKVEQDRLNELLKKRQQYERAQRVIDAAVITANQALAISGAISTIANSKNPVLIAANVIAILAGISAVVGSIRNINAETGSFEEGGYTGDGPKSEKSTARGHKPYTYHKGEFMMNAEKTRKHRDMFEGIHNNDLIVKQLEDGSYYLTHRGIDTDSVVADHNKIRSEMSLVPLLGEMQQIRRLLAESEVTIENNFDAGGFGQSVAAAIITAQLKFNRR